MIPPWHWRSLPLENRTGSEIFAILFRANHAIATLLESPFPTPTAHPQSRYSICAGDPRVVDGHLQLWTPPVGKILPFLRGLLQRSTTNLQPARSPELVQVPAGSESSAVLAVPVVREASPLAQLPRSRSVSEGNRGQELEQLAYSLTACAARRAKLSRREHPKGAFRASICQPNHLPFTGGWLGWLGYDLAWEIETLPNLNPDPLPFPVAYWYEPATFAVLDHWEQTLWLATSDRADLDYLQHQLETDKQTNRGGDHFLSLPHLSPSVPQSLTFLTSQPEYEAAVRQAKKYIRAGDIFQANLSLRFHTTTTADSWSIYRILQQINPSPFASYWQTPWGSVVSCSPERLLKIQGRQAQTRPIAGTRSRGATLLGDRQLAQELITNVKERAEHIMLVDLERNDLGRVCEWGSVKVDELLTIERYSHVMHIVSNVTGTLKQECDPVDGIRSLFPGGTITGCPKVRCLEIIEELEPVRRSLFYGSGGYLDQRGELDLNIFIRTLLFPRDPSASHLVWGQVGAGIVADSDPEAEWYESLHKAEAQIAALRLAQVS